MSVALISKPDATLLNMGQKDVDLSKLCFQANDGKSTTYQVDTIDERLAQGTLKSGKAVSGFFQFTGTKVFMAHQ